MNPTTFVAGLVGSAIALGLFIVFVTWASSRLNRSRPAPSKPQPDEPYTDQQTRDANRWPVNDYDPTSPTRLRPTIPAQRKEQP